MFTHQSPFVYSTVEACSTLLSRDLKRNLFNLFASWCGQYAKPLGVASAAVTNTNSEEEKLQFSALQVNILFKCTIKCIITTDLCSQAMVALLCCGSCFDTQNLAEDGNIYLWLDMLLGSNDDKVI